MSEIPYGRPGAGESKSSAAGSSGPVIPLTHAEQRIYFTQKMHPGSSMWNVPSSLRLASADPDLLEQAVRCVAEASSGFQMRFSESSQGPVKAACEGSDVAIERLDFSASGEQAYLDWAAEQSVRPLAMLDAAPYRLAVADAGAGVVFFYACLHHILADGGALALFQRQVVDAFEALRQGRQPSPVPAVDAHLAYQAEAEYLGSEAFAQDRDYWNRQFDTVPEPLEIGARAAPQSLALDELTYRFSSRTTGALGAYCAAHRMSPFRVVLAAMAMVLSRRLRREDLVFGTATANRHPAELQDAIGMFVSTLALRLQVEPTASFAEVVAQASTRVREAKAHERYPYDMLAADLRQRVGEAPDLIACTLVEVVHQPLPAYAETILHCHGESLIGLACYISYPHQSAAADQSVEAVLDNRVELFAAFNQSLYEPWRVEGLLRQTETLIQQGLEDPQRPVSALDMLGAAERERMLNGFNQRQADWEVETTVHGVIAAVARKQPGRTAAVYRGRALRYGELEARANALARTLRERGAGTGTVVGLLADRSLEIVIAQLAILKSGAAFMPIDAEYPQERIRFMLGDIRAPVILTQTRFIEAGDFGDAAILNLDEPDVFQADQSPLDNHSRPSDLCVAIYTSGSTGQPKGALLEHRSIVNTVLATISRCRIGAEDRLSKHASFSFDASLLEVFTALMAGAELHVIPEEIRLSLSHLNQYFEEQGITWAFLTTQLGEQFMEFIDNRSLRYLMVGGEKLRTFTPRRYRLMNLYGPTECAIYASEYQVERFEDNIPIGRVLPNDRIYVLDKHDQPQPCGAAGELCIAGVGVARGYHNRPEKTLASFVPDPFRPGERMYRTGDLAAWQPDGTLLHLGRMDRQVKLRGFRIELGEIENAMLAVDGVSEAAVADHKDSAGHVFLCGYFVGQEVAAQRIREALGARLPPFMVPAHLMRLDAMPVNQSGKIDRKRLPRPEEESAGATDVVAPEGELETALAERWAEVLDLKMLNAEADFFASGVDSLRAVALQLTIANTLGRDLELAAIFEHSTPRAMAEYLQAQSGDAPGVGGIPVAPPAETYPATVSQQQLYLLSRMQGIGLAYNMPVCLRLEGPLDQARLSAALLTLLDRHASLRTAFEIRDGKCVQRVLDDVHMKCELAETSEDDPDALFDDFVRPFDLAHPPLMRARLVTRSADLHWLLLDFHHIAFDGVSAGIFLRELTAVYAGETLAPLALQQKDVAVWEAERAERVRSAHEPFWLELFSDPPEAELPTDWPRPGHQSFAGDLFRHHLDPRQADALRALAKSSGATLHQIFLAGLAVLVGRWADAEDLCLGTSMSGRDHAGTAQAVGMFVRTLPTRLRPTADKPFAELLAETKAEMLAIHEHGEYPISRLYEKLGISRGPGRHPLFDVNFVMRNTGMASDFALGDLTARLHFLPTHTAKFDLSFAAEETGDSLLLEVDFRTALYARETVARMVGHLLRILAAAASAPQQPLGEIDILGPEERATLLNIFNPKETPAPPWPSVCQAISAQAARRPEQLAVVAENGRLTYAELDRLSNRVARAVAAAGAGPDSIVAVVADRSTWPVVGMLAALKAGAAFVGLDVHYPRERVAFILQDTQAPCLLGTRTQLAGLEFESRTIALDGDLPDDAGDPGLARGGADLAYAIFTSGSTGQPKGVLIEHASMVNFIHWYADHHGIGPDAACAAFAAFSFDVSVAQLFAPLVAGATLHVIPEELRRSPADLNGYFIANQITHAHFPTQFAEHFMRMCPQTSLRQLVVGGDQLKHYRLDAGYRLTNEYGPSETTMACLSQDVERVEPQPPIGSPVANNRVYILDSHGRLCPLGVPGEICVAGRGVGRGYLNRAELTAARFVADPFVPGGRMFRTGDRGRWRPDGVVDFIGRMDFQVKIRGYRVEPGEIEARIKDHPSVLECVVVPLEEPGGNKVLAAYLTANKELDIDALRAALSSLLPDYMVPAHFVRLERMPLNPNGKIDRGKLPRPELAGRSRTGPLQPRNPKEERIAQAWQRVLGHGGFGLFDSFFEIGGDSLSAIGLLADLSETFDITASDIFAQTSIAEQAAHFAEAETGRSARLLRLKALAAPPEPDPAFDTELAQYEEARRRDAVLDTEHIAPPSHVLLTGATGTLGIYLLRELLEATAARITAVVRARDQAAASQRLTEHFRERFGADLMEAADGRLEVVAGDLARADLGLDSGLLKRLEQRVDTVLHSAALTSHYGDWEAFLAANVTSVQQLIEFARRGRAKTLHHVSTTSIGAGAIEGRGRALFTEFDIDKGQQSGNLYVRSKLQAERLLQAARDQGLAVNVYRAGNVTCDSVTGVFQRNVDDNAFYQSLRSFVNLGAAPGTLDQRNMTYVDQAARAVVIAICRPGLRGQTLHIQNPRRLSLSDALTNASLGLRLQRLDFEAFIEFFAAHAGCIGFDEYVERLLVHLGWQDWLSDPQRTATRIAVERSADLLGRCGFSWKVPEARDLRLFVEHALQDRVDILRQLPGFAQVDDRALMDLARHIKPEHFAPDRLLQQENRRVSEVGFVIDGAVETYRQNINGWIGTVRVSGPGACVGEEALPSDGAAVNSVEAIDDVFAFQVRPADLREQVMAHPRLGLALLGLVNAKADQAERLFVSL